MSICFLFSYHIKQVKNITLLKHPYKAYFISLDGFLRVFKDITINDQLYVLDHKMYFVQVSYVYAYHNHICVTIIFLMFSQKSFNRIVLLLQSESPCQDDLLR